MNKMACLDKLDKVFGQKLEGRVRGKIIHIFKWMVIDNIQCSAQMMHGY